MISKNFIKETHYLDRDTNIEDLAEQIAVDFMGDLVPFLEYKQNLLEGKSAGDYIGLDHILRSKEGDLERMNLFFRGPVVEYYFRQEHGYWNEEAIPASHINDTTDEIKRMVGFTLYDHEGHKTDDVNSMTTFTTVKALNEFLNDIEHVCFDDKGHIFPESAHFKSLLKSKGREGAKRQVIHELHEKVKNKYQDREITP
jgi:hypothetical protein